VRGDDHEGEYVEGGKAMTRQEMADHLDGFDVMPISPEQMVVNQRIIDAAVAELRKTCTGCRHFRGSLCRAYQVDGGVHAVISVPLDGSGFCHEWSAK